MPRRAKPLERLKRASSDEDKCDVLRELNGEIDSDQERIGLAKTVVAYLGEDDERVRGAACEFFRMMAREDAEPYSNDIAKLLDDSDDSNRHEAVCVLGRELDERSDKYLNAFVPLLVGKLDDEFVKQRAMDELKNADPKYIREHVDAIIQAIDDEHEGYGEYAVEALSKQEPKVLGEHVEALLVLLEINADHDYGGRETFPCQCALRVMAYADGESLAPHAKRVVSMLPHSEWRVRECAARCMGSLPERMLEANAPALAALLTDEDDNVRDAAANSLSTLSKESRLKHFKPLVGWLSGVDLPSELDDRRGEMWEAWDGPALLLRSVDASQPTGVILGMLELASMRRVHGEVTLSKVTRGIQRVPQSNSRACVGCRFTAPHPPTPTLCRASSTM